MLSKDPYKRFFKKHKIKLSVFILLFGLWWFCLPSVLFKTPLSTVVTSREDHLLGARIAEDGQWRFPETDSVPYRFKKSVLLFEDEYFYRHPGFNPISTLKALRYNLTAGKRRGGSTITQQVMRLSRQNRKRTYFEKLIETFQATRLEWRYDKEKILKLYSSYAPFGSNVVGLSAASWRYFGIAPEYLSWGQAATLAVLPNAPSLIFPGKNDQALQQKRDLLLLKLYQKKIIDQTTYELALEEPLPGKPLPLPDISPHFTEKIKKKYPHQNFKSTIDYHLQQKLNNIVAGYYAGFKQNQIHNIAVLVLDVDTREVLAYIGNAPTTRENQRFVDIISRPRSTGSVLKPFLYAASLDAGELLPTTLLPDYPINIDNYTPKNYDKSYSGAVPANQALTHSLNIPAVRLLKDYGLDRFLSKLKKTHQPYINKPADYYGLALILGGAESSLWDVTKAYAGMASLLKNYNSTSDEYFADEFTEPVFRLGDTIDTGKKQFHPPLFGAGAVYHTLNTLKDLNRPTGEANWEVFDSSQPIAWKTGTSFGFKDAWAVGTTSKYAIGVWVGNADGEGRPGIIGIEAAAPILFDVLAELPQSKWFTPPFDDMKKVNICKQSGYLAGVYCDDIAEEWIPAKGTQTRTCPYHQRIFLDKTEQFRVNTSCYSLSEMKVKNWFSLPPVQEYYYQQQHPEYEALPPFKSDCLRGNEKLMAFVYPQPNQAVILPKNFDENINDVVFKLVHRDAETTVYWYLDQQFIGKTEDFHEISVRPKPGKYLLTAVDQKGNEVYEYIVIKES